MLASNQKELTVPVCLLRVLFDEMQVLAASCEPVFAMTAKEALYFCILSLVLTCRKNRKNRGFFIYRRPSGMRFPNRNDSDSSDHIGDSLGHCFYHVTLVVKIPGDRGPENPRFLRQVRTRLYYALLCICYFLSPDWLIFCHIIISLI